MQFLAHGSIRGADAEFVCGILLFDICPDNLSNLFQAAAEIMVAAFPAVGGVELAAGAVCGLVDVLTGFGFLAVFPDRKERVIFHIDLFHGFQISAVVGVVLL